MATMTLQSNERVWDEILDLETSNRSGSGSPQRSITKNDKSAAENDTAVHYSAGLLQRGDTAELPMKEESSPRKKDTRRRNRDGTVGRRSATRESRRDRARSLSRGLGRSLSKLRSRSKSALRRTKTTTDKSMRKSATSSDVTEQPHSSDPANIHSVSDRSIHSDGNITGNDSVASDTFDHDRGKELMKLFDRQREEFQSVMSASVAKFDKETKYWKNKAKTLKKKYEEETNTKDLRVLTSSVSELERKIRDNEKKSGEKIQDLETVLKTVSEEKDELERKLSSSAQQALVLEQQVKDRDSSLAQLRHVMEKAEEDSESRIELLERQLDKLVEMKSKRPEGSNSQTSSTTASSMTQTLTMPSSQASYMSKASYTSNEHTYTSNLDHTEIGQEDGDNDDSSEVKNLEALLVRILAEKDKLAFENENLRALVAQKNEPTCKPVALANLRTYQLSCRNCIDQSFVGQTRDNNVKQKVRDHFSEVFYVSRGMDVTVNTDETFMKSSFAQHAAGHCKNLQTSDEVVRWCVKNIKVEKISRKVGRDTPPPTEKGNNFEF